jgi:hypothetical protein
MQSDIKLENETLLAEGDKIELTADTIISINAPSTAFIGDVSVLGQVGTLSLIADKAVVGPLHGKNSNAIVCKTTDLILDNNDRRSEGHKSDKELRRALVHNHGDKLTINYANDYPGGVEIEGTLEVVGNGYAGFALVRISHALLLGEPKHESLALSVKDGVTLAINDQRAFTGGTEINGQVRIEELHGHSLNAIVCKTTDLILDSEERRSGDHKSDKEMRRALVHNVNDGLTINYNGDYPGGVAIKGEVRVSDELIVGTPFDGIRITKGNIKLRTTKTPTVNEETDKPQRGERPANGKHTMKRINVVEINTITEELKAMEPAFTETALPSVYEFDLVEQIYELRAEINALKREIAGIKAKA